MPELSGPLPAAGEWGVRSMLTIRAHMPKCNSETLHGFYDCGGQVMTVTPPLLSVEPFWGGSCGETVGHHSRF